MATWGRKPSCTCGDCTKCKRREYMRRWYRSKSIDERRAMRAQRDPERVRAAENARYQQSKHDPAYMQRRRVQDIVAHALRTGRLIRTACEGCGASEVQAHHEDYDKPLSVRWLCSLCHAAEHAPEARAA